MNMSDLIYTKEYEEYCVEQAWHEECAALEEEHRQAVIRGEVALLQPSLESYSDELPF